MHLFSLNAGLEFDETSLRLEELTARVGTSLSLE